MKKKIIISIFVLILIIGLGIGWFLGRGGYRGSEKTAQLNEENDNIYQGAARQDETLDRGGFSVLIPMGWKEVSAPTGVSAMVANAGEEINDPALQKINFHSYYSVSYDTLKERTMEDYASYIKSMIAEFAPGIIFSLEQNTIINGNNAYKIEADLNQQGTDFKVLVFLIKGKDDDVWNMSFNSGFSNWGKNEEEFARIAGSFIVK
jgi:hypothetical protein